METETLKLEKSKALRLFRNASEELKAILIDAFGKECFSGKITDRIKTFEDAYREADVMTQLEYTREYHKSLSTDTVAYLKRKLIAKVLRGDWEPDWTDSNQRKWWPYFVWLAGSGFDFSDSTYDGDFSDTAVGSRLCFPTEELANYFGRQFIDLHREFLTITK
jgi:hypothetical protein